MLVVQPSYHMLLKIMTLLFVLAAGHTLFRRAEAEVLPAAHPIPLTQQQLH